MLRCVLEAQGCHRPRQRTGRQAQCPGPGWGPCRPARPPRGWPLSPPLHPCPGEAAGKQEVSCPRPHARKVRAGTPLAAGPALGWGLCVRSLGQPIPGEVGGPSWGRPAAGPGSPLGVGELWLGAGQSLVEGTALGGAGQGQPSPHHGAHQPLGAGRAARPHRGPRTVRYSRAGEQRPRGPLCKGPARFPPLPDLCCPLQRAAGPSSTSGSTAGPRLGRGSGGVGGGAALPSYLHQ